MKREKRNVENRNTCITTRVLSWLRCCPNFTSTPAFLPWKCFHNFCCCQNQLRPNTHDLLQHLSKPVFPRHCVDIPFCVENQIRNNLPDIFSTRAIQNVCCTSMQNRVLHLHAEYALSTSTPHACAEEECRTIGAVTLSYTVASGVNDDSVSSLCKLKTQ